MSAQPQTQPIEADAKIGHNSVAAGEMIAEDPAVVFREEEIAKMYLDEMADKVAAFEYDLTTAKGRDEAASFAHSIIKHKSKIDNAGKDLTEEHRKATGVVNAVRKTIRDGLDDLKAEARAPLDAWTAKQEALEVKRTQIIEAIDTSILVPIGVTTDMLDSRISKLSDMVIESDVFLENASTIAARRDAAVTSLKQAKSDLIQNQQAQKEREEAEAKAATEEKARIEAEAKAKAEAAEAKRIADAEKAAADEARQDEADRAKKEANARAAEAQAEIDKAKAEAAEAQAKLDAQAEADRVSKQEQERREADEQHRKTVMSKAEQHLTEQAQLSHDQAIVVVAAIANGLIHNVSIKF